MIGDIISGVSSVASQLLSNYQQNKIANMQEQIELQNMDLQKHTFPSHDPRPAANTPEKPAALKSAALL